jgi:hypothetical protein
MDNAKALLTLSALANGVHPDTGELLAADSPYQSADVVRALYVGMRAIETMEKKNQRSKVSPANAGKPWTADEDKQLLELFDQGSDIPSIARYHQRTVPGIQARLDRHGRLLGSSGGVRTVPPPSALPGTSEQT